MFAYLAACSAAYASGISGMLPMFRNTRGFAKLHDIAMLHRARTALRAPMSPRIDATGMMCATRGSNMPSNARPKLPSVATLGGCWKVCCNQGKGRRHQDKVTNARVQARACKMIKRDDG